MDGVGTLKGDIKSGSFGRLYVIFGEETYLREHYKARVIDAFKADGFHDFNLLVTQAEGFSAEDFTVFYEGLPMMSSRKLMVINDMNLMKLDDSWKKMLTESLADIPEYLTILFTFTSVDFKPDKRQKMWQLIDKVGCTVELQKASKADLLPWIKRRFLAYDKEISSDTAEHLIFLCGSLMTNLVTEIEKIASSTKGGEVKKSHIQELASPTLEAQVFDLTDRVSQGDYQGGFEVLQTLFLLKHDPFAICAMLTKHMGRMYTAKLAMTAGKNEKYIMELCGFKSSYPAAILCKSASRVTLKRLRCAVKHCAATDMELRTNLPDNNRKVELLLCRLASEPV